MGRGRPRLGLSAIELAAERAPAVLCVVAARLHLAHARSVGATQVDGDLPRCTGVREVLDGDETRARCMRERGDARRIGGRSVAASRREREVVERGVGASHAPSDGVSERIVDGGFDPRTGIGVRANDERHLRRSEARRPGPQQAHDDEPAHARQRARHVPRAGVEGRGIPA